MISILKNAVDQDKRNAYYVMKYVFIYVYVFYVHINTQKYSGSHIEYSSVGCSGSDDLQNICRLSDSTFLLNFYSSGPLEHGSCLILLSIE